MRDAGRTTGAAAGGGGPHVTLQVDAGSNPVREVTSWTT